MGSRASPAQAYSVAEDEEVEEEEDAEDADALRSGEACRPPEEEARTPDLAKFCKKFVKF